MLKRKLYLKYLLLCLFAPLSSLGAEITKDCSPGSYQEFVKCAENQSMEVRILNKKNESASELEGIANQFVNPDLDVEHITKGSDKSETTASLMFNFSLGGRRSALKTEASAEREKILAETDLSLAELRLGLMLKLYQLRHLENEIKIEEESVTTFTKTVSQFSKRAALTPEQEVSSTIFRMAVSDHQLSLAKLKSSRNALLADVARQTGYSAEVVLRNLPTGQITWPEVKTVGNEQQRSPHLRFAEADLKLAQSQKEKASAESWPDLKIGPVVKAVKDPTTTENFAGVGLSMPLPVFSLNGSSRAYQSKKVIEAELVLQNETNRIGMLRPLLLEKYNSSVSSLKTSLDKKTIEEKHAKIERLFFNGLVSSSLVIEAHRQLFDLEQKRNETEREAIEALGQIYILDNQFSGVIL